MISVTVKSQKAETKFKIVNWGPSAYSENITEVTNFTLVKFDQRYNG